MSRVGRVRDASASRSAGPMSPKQSKFIRSLLAEREGNPDIEPIRDRLNMWRVTGGVTSRDASASIEQLLAIPAKRRESKPNPEGYYLTKSGDVAVVTKSKSGRLFGKQLFFTASSDGKKLARWGYVKGLVFDRTLKPLSLDEARALGKLHGICVICARQLTDPESVEAGIGPVCAKKFS